MLPDSILAENVGVPQAEDVVVELIERRLPGIYVTTLIEQDTEPPYVMVRSVSFQGNWGADHRFMRDYYVSIETFTEGLESDFEAPQIHTAIENSFRRAAYANDVVLDGLGWVEETELIEPARRVSDWANSEGPVQYADLPQGWARFISTHRLKIKRSQMGPHKYEF